MEEEGISGSYRRAQLTGKVACEISDNDDGSMTERGSEVSAIGHGVYRSQANGKRCEQIVSASSA